MSLYLLLSDFHLSDRPPSSCTDSYLPDLLALLYQTVKIARERGVAAVIWAGDVFHIKTPGRTSHLLVQSVIKLCQMYGVPVFIVPGNHDMTNDHLGSLGRQPLGTVFASGAATLLDGWADEHPLYGVPWQQSWDHATVDAALEDYQSEDVPGLVVAHAPLYPPGRELPYEYYPAEDFASSMGDCGSCFYGHVHEEHGVYRVRGVTFCNNGALSRGSLHEYNLTRIPACTIWDSATGDFQKIPLDAQPPEQVFRLSEHQQIVAAQDRAAEFLESIQAANLNVVSVERVMAHIREQQVGAEAEALIAELLEEAGS